MMHLMDSLAVIAILGVALAYAVLSLGPRSLRRRILATVAAHVARLPQVWGVRHMGARAGRAAQTGGGACGGCDSCGSATPATPATRQNAEVRIAVDQIGRRAIR